MRTEEGIDRQQDLREVHQRTGAIRIRQWTDRDQFRVLSFLGDKHPDFNPRRDACFLAEIDGRLVGVFAERVIPLVHVFEVDPSPVCRRVAEALANYASGFTRASGHSEAIFLVDHTNTAIQRFIQERGGVKDNPAVIYTIGVL